MFAIPPEDCLTVQALAKASSLREAARSLGCDPASLVRRAQRISRDSGLLEKVKGRWAPTARGRRMVLWAEESAFDQRARLDEKPPVTLASTAWMAECALIPEFGRLSAALRDRRTWSFRIPPDFEQDLLRGFSDYVVACHPPQDPAIAHKRVARERWVAVAPPSWKARTPLQRLLERPFVRHREINPAEMLTLNGEARLAGAFTVDTLVSVRAAVESGHGWSCVPEVLVRSSLQEGRLRLLTLPLVAQAHASLWWRRDRRDLARDVPVLKGWLEQVLQ